MISKKMSFAVISILIIFFVAFYVFSKSQMKITFEEKIAESFPDYITFIHPNSICGIPREHSLVNVAHIKKNGDQFEISCEYGPLHEGLDYQNANSPDVYMGLIKKCDENVARLIDVSVRIGNNCVFPVDNPIPDNLTDYYAVYFACKENFVSSSTIAINPCLAEMMNNTPYYSGTIGVIDINKRIFYV
jgi:hypothetical protein